MIQRLFLLGLMSVFSASADEITFSLSTTGSFSSGTPADLTFQGIGSLPPGGPPGFNGTTSGGALALTNLGTFKLDKPSKGADTYHNDTFTLDVLFFLPLGINGQEITYSATLAGTVNTQQGNLLIDFGPTQHLTFINGTNSGAFDLTINDLSMAIPGPHGPSSISQVLTGNISNATDPGVTPVPEPFSIILTGSMLAFAPVIRLRRKTRPATRAIPAER